MVIQQELEEERLNKAEIVNQIEDNMMLIKSEWEKKCESIRSQSQQQQATTYLSQEVLSLLAIAYR